MARMSARRTVLAVCAASCVATLAAVAQTQQTGGGQGGAGGQSSANMQVNATVIRKCTISTQPMSFGNYDPVQANATAPLDGQATLTVACTKGTSVTIAMDDGSNAQGNQRRMADRNAYLR